MFAILSNYITAFLVVLKDFCCKCLNLNKIKKIAGRKMKRTGMDFSL